MSNDKTPDNNELDPTVQAVVNALNNPARFQASYVKQNISEGMSIADRVKARQDAKKAAASAAEEGKAKDWLASRGIKGERAEMRMKKAEEKAARRAMKEEALETEETEQTNNTIVVDIFEQDGQIVGLENGVLFVDEDLPSVEYIEDYYGEHYVDQMINELFGLKPAMGNDKTAKPKTPVKKPAPAPKPVAAAPKPSAPAPKPVAGAPKANAPAPKPTGTATTTNTQVKKKEKTPAQKAADKAAANRVAPEKGKADKPTTSTTASNVAQRARDTKLDTGNLDLAISDQLKATDQVVSQNIKDAAAKMKPGELKKTGGFLGFGGKYTYKPGDTSALDLPKDFTKKVADAAANIKLDRDLPEYQVKSKKKPETDDMLQPVEISSKKKDTGAGPAPTTDTGADTGADEGPAGGADEAPVTQPATAKGNIPIRFKIAGQGEVGREAYKKAKESGEIESQDVAFNVRNTKTGQVRSIKKGDPEYGQYYSRYQKMSQAITEALIRMGAVLGEDGWYLNEELLESIYTEYSENEMGSPYYYDNTGRLRIMSESEWTKLGLAEVILERAIAEAMDKVGMEDEDVDNDGDSDKSDDYLANRRKAVAAAIKKGKK